MADDSDTVSQDDIEAMLQQAQGGGEPAPAGSQQSADPNTVDQAEIEALLSGAGASPATGAVSTPPVVQQKSGDSGVSQNDIELLLNKAEEALDSIDQSAPSVTAALPSGMKSFEFKPFSGTAANKESATLELMSDVQLDMTIELGRTHMQLEEVLKLKQGSVVTLDKLAGDPADIYVNGRLVARGEVLVLNDNFCIRVAELIVGENACA